MHKGLLTRAYYAAIVTISNTKNEFEYTKKFISKYTCKLQEAIQEDALNWAEAHTAYYQNKLETCVEMLISYNPKNLHFQRIHKFLAIQVYFDLYLNDASYLEYLLNYLDATERWMRREKLSSTNFKKSYLGFIRVCRQLVKTLAEVNYSKKTIETFLLKEENILGMEWLQRKISHVLELKN